MIVRNYRKNLSKISWFAKVYLANFFVFADSQKFIQKISEKKMTRIKIFNVNTWIPVEVIVVKESRQKKSKPHVFHSSSQNKYQDRFKKSCFYLFTCIFVVALLFLWWQMPRSTSIFTKNCDQYSKRFSCFKVISQ